MTSVPAPDAVSFLEDPFLAIAVAEAEEFVGTAGWDQPPQMFALVRTAELIATQPGVTDHLDPEVVYTPIAQDPLPATGLAEKLQQIAWPRTVAGCVLVQEIVVLPPSAQDGLPDDPDEAAAVAATHPDRTEARLAVGVLRDGGTACLMRLKGEHADAPLRGADLAPNLAEALRLTFA
jgi:hypothetical protein